MPAAVEEYTLQKAANLVLNVDGCIGALFLDLLNSGRNGGGDMRRLRGCNVPVVHPSTPVLAVKFDSQFLSFCSLSCSLAYSWHLCPCAVGMFTPAEIDDIIAIGYLNGLFVLARSAGLIGGSSTGWLLQQ